YKRMDEVLFHLAALAAEAGREDLARVYFKRLIKDHPQSHFLPDAYLAFGDFYFEKNEMENALTLYSKVTGYPDSPVANYARYKMGWCHFNRRDYPAALSTFVGVIDEAQREAARTGGKGSRVPLVREARKDVVRAYAWIGEAGRAWPFFEKVGGGD